MKQLTLAFALLASIGLAQAASHEHDMNHDMAAHSEHMTMHQGMGVVKAAKAGKLQIAHEPIPSLDWPSMTMWFDLNGHAGHGIQIGDRVHFEMMQNEKKKWVIEKIEKQ
ncbi:MAG: copper-binding protein [Gammaproteobacteria bacterium]|nr:copper-binding protein [Gammaproteobacteria bacterium]MBU1777847.1 copper-binding protein [Gammaproteobacteria bacterium]MBU1969291.1 copper-binding protein [Gammaproteobacteria bacterium]